MGNDKTHISPDELRILGEKQNGFAVEALANLRVGYAAQAKRNDVIGLDAIGSQRIEQRQWKVLV